MSNQNSIVKTVILAAGKGTRMKSELPKVLHKVMGKPMVQYSIEAAESAGSDKVCIITGYKGDMVREAVGPAYDYAEQKEQLGTGHAVKCAADFIGNDGDVLILCGDTPLIKGETLKMLVEKHRAMGNGVTLLSAIMDDPTGYGRIIRDEEGNFLKIVEQKDCNPDEAAVKEINAGMYIFKASALSDALGKLTNNNAQGEFYLTDTIELIRNAGFKAGAAAVEDPTEIMGVNDTVQLGVAEKIMNERNR